MTNIPRSGDIGERIRFARRRSRLTQRELGVAIGLSARSIQDYELGVTDPTPHLERIEDALGLPPGTLENADSVPDRERLQALEEHVRMNTEMLRDIRDILGELRGRLLD